MGRPTEAKIDYLQVGDRFFVVDKTDGEAKQGILDVEGINVYGGRRRVRGAGMRSGDVSDLTRLDDQVPGTATDSTSNH